MHKTYSTSDTIAALSTPPGQAGIGIVRVSGPRALEIARRLFHPRVPNREREPASHRLVLGELADPRTGAFVDEVLLSFMKAPHSYTREDVVEINSHSGYALLDKILALVLESGARLALPGEFTYRAYANGRIDLTQAEAVMDVIRAASERGVELASRQARGAMGGHVEALRVKTLEVLAWIEASLDYPDEDVGAAPEEAGSLLAECIVLLEKMEEAYERRRFWVEGVRAVLVGRVNAGKSSILNRLLEEDRAIVTPIPGTTRDVIEATVHIRGVPVCLMDTAGVRTPEGEVEEIGVRRTQKCLEEADLALFVVDGSRVLDAEDYQIRGKCQETNALAVINKIDLPAGIDESSLRDFLGNIPAVCVSALTGQGIDGLRKAVHAAVLADEGPGDSLDVLPNARQARLVRDALTHYRQAAANLEQDAPLEIVASDLEWGMDALSGIIGEHAPEDVLEKVFERFCLGK